MRAASCDDWVQNQVHSPVRGRGHQDERQESGLVEEQQPLERPRKNSAHRRRRMALVNLVVQCNAEEHPAPIRKPMWFIWTKSIGRYRQLGTQHSNTPQAERVSPPPQLFESIKNKFQCAHEYRIGAQIASLRNAAATGAGTNVGFKILSWRNGSCGPSLISPRCDSVSKSRCTSAIVETDDVTWGVSGASRRPGLHRSSCGGAVPRWRGGSPR